MLRLFSFFFFFMVGLTVCAQNEIEGIWLNQEKDGKIKVYQEGGLYYGEIIWIEDNKNEDGTSPRMDHNNPDAKKRSRPIIGTQVLSGLEWDPGEGEWDDGRIYDPKTGHTYEVFARLKGSNTLYLKGFIGFALIGRSTLWERVD